MPHLATWKKSQAAFRNSSEARPISGILPALIADSIPPAILGNRSSGGSGSVISRSLSTKDFRFRLRGGESVNIPISFCMRREIPAKSLEASIEKNSPMERETCCSRRWSRPSGSDPRQTGRSRALVPGIWTSNPAAGVRGLHAGPQPITRVRPTSQEGGDARRPTCSRVQSRPYEDAMLRPL